MISNKVVSSSLITLDLELLYHPAERIVYDLKQNLFEELILKEKDFREFIKTYDWATYLGKNVAILCSVDSIIPTWAYMLIMSKVSVYAHHAIIGNLEELEKSLFQLRISQINLQDFKNQKVVIKGCSKVPVPLFAYGEITRVLLPVVQSIMYGEPCSTVPIFKTRQLSGKTLNAVNL